MARSLSFQLQNRTYEFAPTKVDRSKLYGRKDIVTTSPDGRMLNKGYLDEWGSVVIASSGMGYLDDTKRWHTKAELVAVNSNGQPLSMLPSSFDAPITLEDTVTLDEYMMHEAAMVYILKGMDQAELIAELAEMDELYTFPFCYRAAYDSRPAFLNAVGDNLFMIVGNPTNIEFLGKPQRSEIEEDDFDEEDLDFSMMM